MTIKNKFSGLLWLCLLFFLGDIAKNYSSNLVVLAKPQEFLIKVKNLPQLLKRLPSGDQIKITVINRDIDLYKFDLLNLPAAEQENSLLIMAQKQSGVEKIEPNYLYYQESMANLKGSGQDEEKLNELLKTLAEQKKPALKEPFNLPNKTPDPLIASGNIGWWGIHYIGAPLVWEYFTGGSDKIIVAVLDSGIDYNHPDLSANIWRNSGEMGKDASGKDKATNGIDDDGNGFIDDVIGYDFIAKDGLPYDLEGHGTHVSGIIGAVGNNGLLASGVNKTVAIMPVKIVDKTSGSSDNLIAGIYYAIKNGARIINISAGTFRPSYFLREALDYARIKGVLVVVAAGNENVDIDHQSYYPANFPRDFPSMDNIISVASTSLIFDENVRSPIQEVKSSFSNFGKSTVHLAAPGQFIASTWPNAPYKVQEGTSMATPHVSGAAALYLAKYRQTDYKTLRDVLFKSSDKLPSLNEKVTYGRLNIFKAFMKIYTPNQPNYDWSAAKPLSDVIGKSIEVTKDFAENLTEKEWTITVPNAKFLKLHFAKFGLFDYISPPIIGFTAEHKPISYYETVQLFDKDKNLIDVLSGLYEEPFFSTAIPGDTVRVVFNFIPLSKDLPDDFKKAVLARRVGFLIDSVTVVK